MTIDSYRALAAAAWEYADEFGEPHCPRITVVDNDDPTGVVAPPEPQEDSGSETVGATASEEAPAEFREGSGSADGASPQDADSAAVVGAEPEADYDGAVGDGAEALSGAVGAGADSAVGPGTGPASPGVTGRQATAAEPRPLPLVVSGGGPAANGRSGSARPGRIGA